MDISNNKFLNALKRYHRQIRKGKILKCRQYRGEVSTIDKVIISPGGKRKRVIDNQAASNLTVDDSHSLNKQLDK